jgi:hypothetical protein
MTTNAYRVLGVAPGATAAEIKTAYRERARVIHPDRFTDDPRRAEAAHDAFVELSAAFRTALATTAAMTASTTARVRVAQARVPAQGVGVPQQRGTGTTRTATTAMQAPKVTQDDPMLTLLTVPQRCGAPWASHALEVWALTVVPEARQHLAQASRIARASGITSQRHLTTATAHVLLTLTINGMNGPRVMGVLGKLDAAYDALEIVLPSETVDRLPARVTAARPGHDDEPPRGMLALFALTGAVAAASAWTHFFGFFAG